MNFEYLEKCCKNWCLNISNQQYHNLLLVIYMTQRNLCLTLLWLLIWKNERVNIVYIIDSFSHYIRVILWVKRGVLVVKIIELWLLMFGFPEMLMDNRGKSASNKTGKLRNLIGINIKHVAAYIVLHQMVLIKQILLPLI